MLAHVLHHQPTATQSLLCVGRSTFLWRQTAVERCRQGVVLCAAFNETRKHAQPPVPVACCGLADVPARAPTGLFKLAQQQVHISNQRCSAVACVGQHLHGEFVCLHIQLQVYTTYCIVVLTELYSTSLLHVASAHVRRTAVITQPNLFEASPSHRE